MMKKKIFWGWGLKNFKIVVNINDCIVNIKIKNNLLIYFK